MVIRDFPLFCTALESFEHPGSVVRVGIPFPATFVPQDLNGAVYIL